MQLPRDLSDAIARRIERITPSELTRAAADLTSTYRAHTRTTPPRLDSLHRAAYLVTRLPATYAVVTRVLQEINLRVPDIRIETMLDLGAGPGTAMWAAAEIFPDLRRVTLVERDEDWIIVGKALTTASRIDAIRAVNWEQGSISGQSPSGRFDLVTMSYVLNELAAADKIAAVRAAWERTDSLLLIAEPGTPAGFENIREFRRELIALGAHVVAPCPHARACPMEGGNWCHFAQRLPRSSVHRVAKSAELGYEDEKYSYVVFSRAAVRLPDSRILRHPRKHSGHVELELCTPEGLKRETISRKSGDKYKQARNAEWGDAW